MTSAVQRVRPLDDPRRLVYAGNVDPPARMASLSSWDLDVTTLVRRLAHAEELIVLDALSFPWEFLDEEDRSLPMVLALPAALDGPGIVAALGPVVLEQLSPQDRLVESRGPVREHLSAAFGLLPETWIEVTDRGDVVTEIIRHTRRGLVELDTRIGRFVAPSGDLVTDHLNDHGTHQGSDLAMLLAVTRQGATVLDVGAHVGTFTVPLARTVGDSGRVVAFEAAADMANLLLENVEINGLHDVVEVRHLAVGTSATPQALASRTPGNSGATRWHATGPSTGGQTRATTLDAWWHEAGRPGVDIVKIDVEGAEPAVLSGGDALLSTCRPILMVELILGRDGAAADVLARLDDLDYVLYRNTLERNRSDDRFDAVRVTDLALDQSVVDVLAVPQDSPMVPTLDGGAA